ncbi:hypothetical protein V6N12_058401 [Hibiscus sabdariffa]|uniref:Uncharacterized protein n=1 Tax=Hibiscus sabdariffa TaxID=183260 RepID=A0ABR2ES17_9ROSI
MSQSVKEIATFVLSFVDDFGCLQIGKGATVRDANSCLWAAITHPHSFVLNQEMAKARSYEQVVYLARDLDFRRHLKVEGLRVWIEEVLPSVEAAVDMDKWWVNPPA